MFAPAAHEYRLTPGSVRTTSCGVRVRSPKLQLKPMDPKLAVCLSWSLAAVLAACSGGSHPAASMGPPSITAQPSSQSIALGQTATFTVAATGTPPLNYQWQ